MGSGQPFPPQGAILNHGQLSFLWVSVVLPSHYWMFTFPSPTHKQTANSIWDPDLLPFSS